MVPQGGAFLNFVKEILYTWLTEGTEPLYPRLVILRVLDILFFRRLIVFAV